MDMYIAAYQSTIEHKLLCTCDLLGSKISLGTVLFVFGNFV
jgi:hypothetical protein